MNDFTCNQFIDLIFNYIDNELSTDEKLKMEEHMEKCSECKIEYQKAKNLLETIKESRYTTDNRLYTTLVPQLNQMKKRSILNKIRVYGSVAVAAMITIVMLIYVMPVMNPKISNNSLAFDAEMNEMQLEEAKEEIIIEETREKSAAGEIMPSQIALYSDRIKSAELTMTDYLNTYAPDYVDNTEALYVSYDDVDLPGEIVTDKVVSDIKYSIYVIDRFANVAFDVGEATEYSTVYYSDNNTLRYVIILKFNSG